MNRREWSPVIPGTDYSRLEFLHDVQRLSRALGRPAVDDVLKVAAYDLLSMAQLARIAGCQLSRIRGIFDAYELPRPSSRGRFTLGSIDTLILVCKKRALGESPPAELMEMLTGFVNPRMLELLTGTPVSTYWYHRHNRDRKFRA